ncbi:MAG: hypothetical protein LGR52_07285 [Candidatus Thiosymbion ectosymbiont of Robbea hypermnestra]|nr:hypothetical protein [Candidatus Thiosymbion ectosymbiont of Robbea hypermnestra]
MANGDSTRTLNEETIVRIRDAWLIGRTAFGEIERLSAAQEIRAMRGKQITGQRRVIHPTGTSDVVSRFADALRALDSALAHAALK